MGADHLDSRQHDYNSDYIRRYHMDKKDLYFEKEYMPHMNRIGKITGYLGVLLSFAPAFILAVVYGIFPKPAALLTAFVSIASAVGELWFVEPIFYFTILGPVGTYMAFLSGNISNMRLPCASTVSYTHLDVYKRQPQCSSLPS